MLPSPIAGHTLRACPPYFPPYCSSWNRDQCHSVPLMWWRPPMALLPNPFPWYLLLLLCLPCHWKMVLKGHRRLQCFLYVVYIMFLLPLASLVECSVQCLCFVLDLRLFLSACFHLEHQNSEFLCWSFRSLKWSCWLPWSGSSSLHFKWSGTFFILALRPCQRSCGVPPTCTSLWSHVCHCCLP